jgi:hypothetical protein
MKKHIIIRERMPAILKLLFQGIDADKGPG